MPNLTYSRHFVKLKLFEKFTPLRKSKKLKRKKPVLLTVPKVTESNE